MLRAVRGREEAEMARVQLTITRGSSAQVALSLWPCALERSRKHPIARNLRERVQGFLPRHQKATKIFLPMYFGHGHLYAAAGMHLQRGDYGWPKVVIRHHRACDRVARTMPDAGDRCRRSVSECG